MVTAQKIQTQPTPDWTAAFEDVQREHDFVPLRIEGRVPDDLQGTLYRNGPGYFTRPSGRVGHWFDGDGVISAVRFHEGAAQGAVRIIDTPTRARELSGEPLVGAFGTRGPWLKGLASLFTKKLRNPANTSIMVAGDKLLALYEAGLPTALSPQLDTLGPTDLEGAVVHTFSAHPHYVASRNMTYNFGVRYGPRCKVDFYALDPSGRAQHLAAHKLSSIPMVHDFIATDRHLVLFASPIHLSVWTTLLGLETPADALRWRPEEGTEVLVVPIDAPTSATRFKAQPFYQWHFANAYEEGESIVIDLVDYQDFDSHQFLQGLFQKGTPSAPAKGQLARLRLNPRQKRIDRELLFGGSCEFPRVAPHREGQKHSTVYMATHSSPHAAKTEPFDRLTLVDVDRQCAHHLDFGPGTYPSEPVFVPRANARDDRDGYLVAVVFDSAAKRSFAVVIDAQKPEEGAIARAWFEASVPPTFHGTWLPSSG